MVDGIKVVDITESKADDVTKYIFKTVEGDNEVSLIRKEHKNILCLPTQTNCNLGCRFCHLTGTTRKVENLSKETLVAYVEYFLREDNLLSDDKVVHVSFMGAGEPLSNLTNLVEAMRDLFSKYGGNEYGIKFSLASTIPSESKMLELIDMVKDDDYLLKFHHSLHGIDTREQLMLDTVKARDAINLVKRYEDDTANYAEFHYSLVEDINDTEDEINALEEALYEGAAIKFLVLNPVEDLEPSSHLEEIVDYLRDSKKDLKVLVYTPPGRDVGASCGQFKRKMYNRES